MKKDEIILEGVFSRQIFSGDINHQPTEFFPRIRHCSSRDEQVTFVARSGAKMWTRKKRAQTQCQFRHMQTRNNVPYE